MTIYFGHNNIEVVMQVAISVFKTQCTRFVREMSAKLEPIQITNHGKVMAVLTPPPPSTKANPACGSLKGSVTYQPGWDAPLGPEDWDAGK